MEEFGEALEQLEALVGKEGAMKVAGHFKGESVYFPKRIGLAERHDRICAELRGGKSYGEIARKYGYSKSYVRKLERKALRERRAARKAGAAAPERTGSPGAEAESVKPPASTKPRGGAGQRARPPEQGELFYDGL